MTAWAYASTGVVTMIWALAFVGACCFVGETLWRLAGWLTRREQ